MLDATLRDRAKGLLTASRAKRRSAVHGDGRDGGGGAYRGGRRPCHSHGSGATGGAGAESGDSGRARRARRRRGSTIPRRWAFPRCASASPGITARLMAARWMPARIVVTTGSSGAFILALSGHVRARRSGCGHGARLSAVSPYSHRARLRAGADRDLERNPSCADRRGPARRPSQDAAEGRAGRKPGQSHRHDDVPRGAHQPDIGGGRRRHPFHFRRNLSRPRLCVSGGDGGGAFPACARHQFVLEIFLHDRLAGRLDGGAGTAGAADRAAAAKSRDFGADAVADCRRGGVRRPRRRWKR